MGPVGVPEMFLIFTLALLLFGPKKLPELGRMLGKGLSEFRRAKNELKSTFETHMRELEKETQPESPSYSSTSSSTGDYSSKAYPYPYDEYSHSGSENGYTSGVSSESHGASPQPHGVEATEPAHANSSIESTDSATEQTHVAGTVPRSNGVQPIEPVPVSAEEDHRG